MSVTFFSHVGTFVGPHVGRLVISCLMEILFKETILQEWIVCKVCTVDVRQVDEWQKFMDFFRWSELHDMGNATRIVPYAEIKTKVPEPAKQPIFLI